METKLSAQSAGSMENLLASMESSLAKWTTTELITFLHSTNDAKRRKKLTDDNVDFESHYRNVIDQLKSYTIENLIQHELKVLDDVLNSNMYFTEPVKHNDFEELHEADVKQLTQMMRSDYLPDISEECDSGSEANIIGSHTVLDNVLSRMDNMLSMSLAPSSVATDQLTSDDDIPSQTSTKKPRKRVSKKAAASPVPAGIASLPSPTATAPKPAARVSRSAKWMSRDAKAARSHVPPADLLRCVLHELEAQGVLVYSMEEKVHHLLQNGACTVDAKDVPEDKISGHIRNLDYAVLCLEAQEEAEKPYGRTASTAAAECCELYREYVDSLHAQWESHLSMLRETSSYHWTTLTQLQGQLHQITFNLHDMPPTADLVVNPFAWNTAHAHDMTWTLQLPDSRDLDRFHADAKTDISSWKETKSHPFIHESSMYYGSVTADECLSDRQLRDIDAAINGFSDVECKDDAGGDHKRKRSAKSFYDPAVAPPTKAPKLYPSSSSADDAFESSRSKVDISSIEAGACFDFCVDRTNALLSIGHAVIVLDKEEAFESEIHATAHRALLLHTIMTRVSTIDASKLPSPVLMVVRLKDLYAFRDALQHKARNTLLYFGNEDDREVLRGYMTGTFLYSQTTPAVILTHYEAFCADLVHLKEIIWGLTVFDSPWSIVTNQVYQHVYDEISSLTSKYRIFSAGHLAHPEHEYLPSLVNLLSVVFPSIWSILDDTVDILSDPKAVYYVVRLLGSLTAVCNEVISPLASSSANPDEVSEYYEIVKLLPYFEWHNISVSIDNETKKAVYRVRDKVIHANDYPDINIDEELQHISVHLVGVSAARKKVKKSHTKTHVKRHSKSKKSEASAADDEVKLENVIKSEDEEGAVGESPLVSVEVKEEFRCVEEAGGGEESDKLHDIPEVEKHSPVKENVPESLTINEESAPLDEDSTPANTPTHAKKPPLDSKALQEIIGKSATKSRRSATPKMSKVTLSKKLDPAEEKNRSIFRRGDQWQVIVQFAGRHRYLGSFRTEAEAQLAYETSLQQRVDAEARNSDLPKAITTDTSRKKKKTGDASDDLAKMTDDEIYSAVRAMAAPAQAVGLTPYDWNGPEARPPAYACLQGLEGFISYMQHKQCILGKMGSSVRALASKLGCDDFCGMAGILEDVDVHLGCDASIARRHAKITVDDNTGTFNITCLSAAGMFIDGSAKYPSDGCIPLRSKTVIQIGSRIFFFTLPRDVDAASILLLSPLQYRRQLLIAMISSMKLRLIREPLSESQQEESQEYKTYSDITNKLIENVLGASRYSKSSAFSGPGNKRKQRDGGAPSAARQKLAKPSAAKPQTLPDMSKPRSNALLGIPGNQPAAHTQQHQLSQHQQQMYMHQQQHGSHQHQQQMLQQQMSNQQQHQMQYMQPAPPQQQDYSTPIPQQMYQTSTITHNTQSTKSHAFTPLASPYLASDIRAPVAYASSGPSLLSQTANREHQPPSAPSAPSSFLSNEMMSTQSSSFMGGFSVPMSTFDVIHSRLPTAEGSVPTSRLPSLVNNATPLTSFSQTNSVITAVNRLAQLPPSLPKQPPNSASDSTQQ